MPVISSNNCTYKEYIEGILDCNMFWVFIYDPKTKEYGVGVYTDDESHAENSECKKVSIDEVRKSFDDPKCLNRPNARKIVELFDIANAQFDLSEEQMNDKLIVQIRKRARAKNYLASFLEAGASRESFIAMCRRSFDLVSLRVFWGHADYIMAEVVIKDDPIPIIVTRGIYIEG